MNATGPAGEVDLSLLHNAPQECKALDHGLFQAAEHSNKRHEIFQTTLALQEIAATPKYKLEFVTAAKPVAKVEQGWRKGGHSQTLQEEEQQY